MPDLEQRLVATRDRLLDDIHQPDLAHIAGRAAGLRRRRQAGRAGTAMLALVAAGALVTQPWAGPSGTPPPAATPDPVPTPTRGPVYTDAGITVNGIFRPADELPGDLTDVEFIDPDHGWALAANCTGNTSCRYSLGFTSDGGLTWTTRGVPAVGGNLVALGPETLVLHGSPSLLSTDGGASWSEVTLGATKASLEGNARPLLRPGGGAGCAGSVVEVWSQPSGYRGELANPPPINVCWVAATRAADGGWWVGGTSGGQPAAAVTYDGGVHWAPTLFPEVGDGARVTTLGDHTYVAVVAGDALRAIYHGQGRGTPLTRTWSGSMSIGGEPVPLLDGRLLVVDGKDHWFVSDPTVTQFTQTTADKLPRVSRLWRTPAGYLAFDIVVPGYAAFSSDGSTWRKLHVH